MKLTLLVLAILATLVSGCRTPTEPVVHVVGQSLTHSFSLTSGSSWVEGTEDSLDSKRSLRVSLTLPASRTDVYFLYTNVANNTSVQTLGEVTADQERAPSRGAAAVGGAVGTAPGRPQPRLERTSLRNLVLPHPSSSRATALPPAPSDPAVGATGTFVDSLDHPSVSNHAMTLRVKQPDLNAGRTLYVWVVDDCYAGSVAAQGSRFKVTTAMAQALADKFLKPNDENDIYGVVSRVLGTEWTDSGEVTTKDGSSYGDSYIHGGKQIHIVLADLNLKADPDDRRFGGGYQGYFHGWNNQRGAGSNEKILFAIDANSLANPDEDGVPNAPQPEDDAALWSLLGSYYPNDIVATLAHEFQHMVHFYQKALLNGTSEAAPWINEMASMAVEDLVADQMGFRGPRGLEGGDYTSGTETALIFDGRLPLFNGTHELVPLQAWGDGIDALPSYANAYAFGAWLTRNYGGPVFWRDLIQSPATTVQGVVDTLNAHRHADEPLQTYASMVRNWGLAVFYGSRPSQTPIDKALSFSAVGSGSFDFLLDSWTYKTGSIDLYHYPMEDRDGFYIKGGSGAWLRGPSRWNGPPSTEDSLAAGATWMSYVGSGTGGWSRTVTLPPFIVVTVVARIEEDA